MPRLGDEDNEPALNGWNDTEGLLAMVAPSNGLNETREVCIGFVLGTGLVGGELVSDPIAFAALRADMGLEPLGGTSPWNVERLPYAWIGSGSSSRWRCAGRDPTSTALEFWPRLSPFDPREGWKKCSSAPMNLELRIASESSTRKLQSFRYETSAENCPTGVSVVPRK